MVEGVHVSGLPGDKFHKPMFISKEYAAFSYRKHRAKLEDEELRKFARDVFGQRPRKPRFARPRG
jgi:hypothetical protein